MLWVRLLTLSLGNTVRLVKSQIARAAINIFIEDDQKVHIIQEETANKTWKDFLVMSNSIGELYCRIGSGTILYRLSLIIHIFI